MLLIGLVVACSDDDPVATPDPPTTTVAPSTTADTVAPLTTTTTTAPQPEQRWIAVVEGYRPDVELLTAGEEPRRPLRYRAEDTTDIGFVVRDRWNDSRWSRRMPIDPTTEFRVDATSQPRDDGLWLEITAAGVALHHRADNTVDLYYRGERGTARENAFAVLELLELAHIPMPDEPIGVGARWRVGAAYGYSPVAAEFELTAIDGDLVTLAAVGAAAGYDGDRYGGNYLDVTHDGILRLDLASGQAAGVMRAEGIVQDSVGGERTPGTEEPFARETIVDIPARFRALDDRRHTITIQRTTSGPTLDTDELTLFYTGDIERNDDGGTTFDGMITTTAEATERLLASPTPIRTAYPTDLTLTAAGELEADERFIDSLWDVWHSYMPPFTSDWYLHTGAPSSLAAGVQVPGLCLGGCAETAEWEIVDVAGSTFTARLEHPYSLDIIQRGAIVRADGIFTGEWTVDLFDPFALEGWLAYEGTARFGEAYDIDDLRFERTVTTDVG